MPPIGPADETLRVFINVKSDAKVVLDQVVDSVNRGAKKLDQGTRRPKRAIDSLNKSIQGATASLAAFGRRYLALATTFAGTAVLFSSVRDAQKFGTAIAEIGTIFDGTSTQLATIEQDVLALSEALGLPEQIAAKGFYQIISSDISDAADAMIVLREGSELATVGLADVKETVDVLTSVIKAYQRPVTDAADITNVLFRTVIKGKTTIPELAHSLGQVLPIAATLGVELEEVAAAIATLTQGGIETNTAVIQLRQALNQLLKPSAEAVEVMNAYGLNIDVATIRSEGFVEVLRRIEETVGDNAGAMSKLFGNIRGLIPVLALTGKQADQFRQVMDYVSQDMDKVGESLAEFLETPFKKFSRFFNALRLRLREVGEIFIRTFAEQIDAQGGVDAVVDKIDAAFGSLRSAAEVAGKAVGGMVAQLDGLTSRLGGIERAEAAFSALGRVVAGAINVAFQYLGALITTAVENLLRIPEVIDAIGFEVKTLLNDIATGIINSPFIGLFDRIAAEVEGKSLEDVLPFPEVFGVKDQAEINRILDETQQRIEEIQDELGLSQFSVNLGASREEIQRIQGLQRELVALNAVIVSGKDALKSAPADLTEIFSFERIEEVSGPIRNSIDEVGAAWGDFMSSLDSDAPERAAERIGIISRAVQVYRDVVSAARDHFEVQLRVSADDRQNRANLFASLGELQNLAADFGIEVPVEFLVDRDSVTRETVQDMVRFLESSGSLPTQIIRGEVSEEFVADADRVRSAFARSVELLGLQDSMLSKLRDTEVERAHLADRTRGLRRAELEEQIRLLGATQEMRQVLLNLFNLQEEQSVADLLGFKNFDAEFERASRGLTDTVEKQRAALDKNNASLAERAVKLRSLGLIDTQQYEQLLSQIVRAEEQFQEKMRQDILGQAAFQGVDQATIVFEEMEMAAKRVALEVTGISKAANDAEFRTLRDAFNRAMDSMSQGGAAFLRGFAAGWRDTFRVIGDEVRNGIETARSAIEGFRGAMSGALSDFIAGAKSGGEAWEAFRQALGRSLADTLAQSVTDVFTGTVADLIAQVFARKTTEALSESVAEALAQGALQGPLGLATGAATGAAQVGATAATEAAEQATEAASIGAAVTTALAPVVVALGASATALDASAAFLGTSAGEMGFAAGELIFAATELSAAAVALSTSNFGSGGIVPGSLVPAVEPYANGGIPGPIESLGVGGVRSRETFARIAETGTPEAVVPLPGNGRSIPVEFRGEGMSSQGNQVTVQSNVTFVIGPGGMRDFERQLATHSRSIEKMVESALVSGANRGLKKAVKRAANG